MKPLNQHWLKLLYLFYYKFIYVYVNMYNSIMDGFSSYNYYSNMVITNAKTYF